MTENEEYQRDDAEEYELSQLAQEHDDDDPDICPTCNGSGEGQYDGTHCRSCRGSGVLRYPSDDADDCDPPDPSSWCDEEGNRL